MKVKYEKLWDEYQNLPDIGKIIIDYADFYSLHNFNKEIVLTHIFRTQKEQDRIYKGKSRNLWIDAKRTTRFYDINPWLSDHQFYQAADIRTKFYTIDQVKEMARFLRSNFCYNKLDNKPVVLYHQVGNLGYHFHIRWCKETICKDSYQFYF